MEEFINKPELLVQRLIQFKTINGKNDEKPCIDFIESLLSHYNIESRRFALDDNRPNLFATIKGKCSNKKAVMMYGHVDVVEVLGQDWSYDPFEGVINDNMIYGRGAVDMKGPLALFMIAFIKIQLMGGLDYDLHLLVLSDEENTGKYGAQYMIEQHPDLFKQIGFALGEIGGFSIKLAGKTFYPVMIAEKQVAHIKITTFSKAGHASMAQHETSIQKLSKIIDVLQTKSLTTRVTQPVRLMIQSMAKELGFKGFILKQLLNPAFTDYILKMLGSSGDLFDPLLHNSINVTKLSGGHSINVIPSHVELEADYRILPGVSIEEAVFDIIELIYTHTDLDESDFSIEVVSFDHNPGKVDMQYFNLLKHSIKKFDDKGHVVPFVLAAVTDARYFSRIGIQTYGFTPLKLKEGYDFTTQAHNANESLPIDALDFGVNALIELLVNQYGHLDEHF